MKINGKDVKVPKGYKKPKARLKAQRHAIAHSGVSSGDERLIWLRLR